VRGARPMRLPQASNYAIAKTHLLPESLQARPSLFNFSTPTSKVLANYNFLNLFTLSQL
jgi:hypothetical protein